MFRNTHLAGFMMMAAAMILVGSTVVVSKIIGQGMPPFMATALRFAIASPVFALLLWFSGQKIPVFSRREWGLLVIQAAAGSVAYTVLLILGLTFTSGANAGVIVGTLPIIMAVLAITAFGERPTWQLVISITTAGFGVFLVTLDSGSSGNAYTSTRDLMGVGLILLAVVGEALFLLLNKKITTPIPPLVLSTLMSTFGFLLAIGAAGVEYATGGVKQVSQGALIAVLYYALIPTVVGFLLWYEGSARSTPGNAALATAFLPVAALVMVSVFLHETITGQQTAGCVLVVIGILLGVRRQNPDGQ